MGALKLTFIILGSISLILGILGLFLPGLPTTPFLLLTSGLYLRSSDKLYNKLISNKYIGYHLKAFEEKKGMTPKLKVVSILIMWIMIGISIFCVSYPINIIIIIIGITGSIVMGFIIRTVK